MSFPSDGFTVCGLPLNRMIAVQVCDATVFNRGSVAGYTKRQPGN